MKTKNYLFVMLIALMLSACNDTDGIIPPPDEQPITITADVIQYTRAGYQSEVLMPEEFVMDISQNGDDKFNYSLVKMKKDKGANIYSADRVLLWADDTHKAEVKAMTIPMGLTTVDDTKVMEVKVSLQQDVESNVVASDLLGATSASNGGITIEGSNIHIEFQHLLSKLDISYSFSSEIEGKSIVVKSITLQNICTTGGYSYANMALDATNMSYDNIAMFHSSTEDRKGTAEAIFYPYKPTEDPILVINATIDNDDCNFSCPVKLNNDNGFISGQRYTMDVSIIGTSVSGTTATIANGWDTNTDEESFVTE